MFTIVLVMPVVIPVVFFGSFRASFIMVSGAANSYARKGRNMRKFSSFTKQFLKNMLSNVIILPIFMYLGFWTWYFVLLSESKVDFPWAGTRYFQQTDAMPNPVYFFGWIGLFSDPIEYVIDCVLLCF